MGGARADGPHDRVTPMVRPGPPPRDGHSYCADLVWGGGAAAALCPAPRGGGARAVCALPAPAFKGPLLCLTDAPPFRPPLSPAHSHDPVRPALRHLLRLHGHDQLVAVCQAGQPADAG